MPQPTIAECYEGIVEDPSLLCLFPEMMSIQELPLMGALQSQDYFGEAFACITSPAMWGKAGMELVTSNGQKISGEVITMAILLQIGWGKETWAW